MGNGPSTINLKLTGWDMIDSGCTPLSENFYIFIRKDKKPLRVVIKPLYIGDYKMIVTENKGDDNEYETVIKGNLEKISKFLENKWGVQPPSDTNSLYKPQVSLEKVEEEEEVD